MSKDRYEDAGVNLARAERIVSRHASHINATMRKGFHGSFGGFGAGIDLGELLGPDVDLSEVILVSTTDGVGTKIMLAIEEQWHEGIGEDCVAMCTNDLWAMGATPLWFMNYMAMNTLSEEHVSALMRGMERACARETCMLVGGETAEMPGMYVHDEGYELAGFCVGAMSRNAQWDRVASEGDWVIGCASSGMHSNGLSLVRHGVVTGEVSMEARIGAVTLRKGLLEPTRQYGAMVKAWRGHQPVEIIKRAAHVTGGGLWRGTARLIGQEGLQVTWSQGDMWEPESVAHVREAMGLSWHEGAEVWNMGAGFLLLCEGAQQKTHLDALCVQVSREVGFRVWVQGRLVSQAA